MKIIYSSKFLREFKKLTSHIQDTAEQHERIFRNDPFDPLLKTHKLHGKFKDFWSFSIGYKYRIVCEFDDQNIYFHSVGNHNIYE